MMIYEEISDKGLVKNGITLYNKLIKFVSENMRLYKQITQLNKEKNDNLIKEVHTLKYKLLDKYTIDAKLEEMKKTIHMLNPGIIALGQTLLIGKSTQSHEDLKYKKNKTCKKTTTPRGGKNRRGKGEKKTLSCYYYIQ